MLPPRILILNQSWLAIVRLQKSTIICRVCLVVSRILTSLRWNCWLCPIFMRLSRGYIVVWNVSHTVVKLPLSRLNFRSSFSLFFIVYHLILSVGVSLAVVEWKWMAMIQISIVKSLVLSLSNLIEIITIIDISRVNLTECSTQIKILKHFILFLRRILILIRFLKSLFLVFELFPRFFWVDTISINLITTEHYGFCLDTLIQSIADSSDPISSYAYRSMLDTTLLSRLVRCLFVNTLVRSLTRVCLNL